MASRKWIKLWCEQWLTGTLRDDEYQDLQLEMLLKTDARQDILRVIIRGIWADVLALAGDGRYGDIGEIKLSDKIGLTDEQIADILYLPLKVWGWAKDIFIRGGDEPRINISKGNIISIINWSKYQSEYDRQKPYRERKKEESNKEERKKEIDIEVLEVEREVEVEAKIVTPLSNQKLQPKVTTDENPEWLLLLLEYLPITYDSNWIEMIERSWTDIDLLSMTQEFVSFWKDKKPDNVNSLFINSLQHARDKGHFKSKNDTNKYKRGKFGHIVQT